MLRNEKAYITLVVIHLIIAVGIYLFNPLSKVYFLAVFLFFLFKIFSAPKKDLTVEVLTACAYIVGAEVFLRMTQGNFLYESSKYIVILYLLIGMLLGKGLNRGTYIYFIYLFALIPGVIVASWTLNLGTNVRTAITFNISGPVCLGIAAIYCYNNRISLKNLQSVLLAMLLPLLSTTLYLFLYSPNIRDVLRGTQSNFEASGGFGPNQVATVLGLGVFILVSRFFIQSKSLVLKVFNMILIGLMAYRGIVTFSRGGIIVGAICILCFIGIYYRYSPVKRKMNIISTLIVISIAFIFVWIISSVSTLGLIDKRYSNQDAIGREKEDITTGRSELLTREIDIFFNNPFFGAGVGKLKEIRAERSGENVASHNEMSRILGEHGIMGLFALMVLLLVPIVFRLKNRRNVYFYSFYLFWFLTINHSSMRIAAPAFIYGLCLLNVVNYKKITKRKQFNGTNKVIRA
ncbi:O-antigen ligase family protein [Flavivirga algicola]|uniref:O-antigen ligase family protein n=1 Tax=Flavivirga algicola TaxID=2729136 RepID=A0ABX1RU94_9FLAO|nr:O-antigen ligase family protein [Flavivirga algicola]NMH86338.1 O-antigen ligase family protein [Flavivirga algicola]